MFDVVVTNLWVFSYGKDRSKDSFVRDDKLSSLSYDHVLFSVISITCLKSFSNNNRNNRSIMYQVATNVKAREIVITDKIGVSFQKIILKSLS